VDQPLVPPEHLPAASTISPAQPPPGEPCAPPRHSRRRHEADILAVRLVGDQQVELARQLAHRRLRQPAQREAQESELLARGGEQEIALVARRIRRAVQLGAVRPITRRT
jgi:hypothetical protein